MSYALSVIRNVILSAHVSFFSHFKSNDGTIRQDKINKYTKDDFKGKYMVKAMNAI
jgi:hypothetical protein